MGTIKTCGIVEKIERLHNTDDIISIIGKRTVYKRQEIEEMCRGEKDVLVILFRQAENFQNEIRIKDLQSANLINGVPQTITKLSEKAKKWILQHRQF